MNALFKAVLLPFYIVSFLLDLAVFFLLVRLLAGVFPVAPLLFLERIGSAGVDLVTGTVAHHLRRWRAGPPLSVRQEEVLTLILLLICRWALASIIGACGCR